jgi:hypothetical protein
MGVDEAEQPDELGHCQVIDGSRRQRAPRRQVALIFSSLGSEVGGIGKEPPGQLGGAALLRGLRDVGRAACVTDP